MFDQSGTAARLFIAALLACAFIGAVRAQQSVPSAAEIERRQQMIDECEQNHGSETDCVRETDTELRAERLQASGRIVHLRAPSQ